MTEILHKPSNQLVELTADVIAAYVSNNPVPVGDLPALIADVYASINKLGSPVAPMKPLLTPAVPIKKTVTANYIISLEDGKRYKTLRRHLAGAGMTPEEYRTKWSLPSDYPMVAASYSARRSELAKSIGLGRKPGTKPVTKQAKRAPRKAT